MTISEKKITVLYIDDEEDNLFAFKAAFRREYEVYTAISAAEGLKILNESLINVIIADQRMPKSTGVQFFDIVRVAHPNAIRILITGYTDVEVVVEAINKGQIFRYIKKPWNILELDMAIKNGYEVYSAREQLKNKVDELERTNEELNKFVYSTSHDLRSPLASIMGVLNLAKMEDSVVDPNGYLGMIETCVNKMDFFILKVVEYYRSHRVEDTIEPIDFKALIKNSVDLAHMIHPGITFRVNINEDIPFRSDAFRVSIILDNLISNAVKYQRPDEVNPTIKIEINVNEKEANILIEDNGVGIVEEHLNNIFKMFFRSNANVKGLGIGLYIVKEALTRIGGEISVKSTYGVGTSFLLTIPNK